LKCMKINKLRQGSWLLAAILLVALIIRLWSLGSIPPGLTPDEAALGYNAYSILKSGRDEYGKILPLIFKSFGDYKPGLYVYLNMPFVAALGLNEFSTRLPSALAGVISVWLIYLICRKLFEDPKIGYCAAFIAAVNPWLIYFSRAAWEANVSLTLTLTGIYFFLRSFEKPKLLFLSVSFFALTLLTYQGAKMSTLIVVAILAVTFWKEFKESFLLRNVKLTLLSAFWGILMSIPVILSLFGGQVNRLKIYSIFSYPRPEATLKAFLAEGGERVGDLNYYLFHPETLNFVRVAVGRWFNNFSGKFLFFDGDWANPVGSAPYQGILLLSDILLLPAGLYAIFKSKLGKGRLFILLWFVFAPLSAALSRDEVNAARDLNLAVPLVIICGFGLLETVKWLNSQKASFLRFAGYGTFAVFYLFAFIYFIDAYFIHVPAHNSNIWRYGYREAVRAIISLESKYKNIIVEQSFNQPYIYFLFYKVMDNPKDFDLAKYQRGEKLVDSQYVGDVGFQEKIDNIEFKQIDLSVLKNLPGVLIAAGPFSFPVDEPTFSKDFSLIKEIKYLNGRDTAFKIVETK
jgi:4-amino-4-deoxy-L-arabinose transferase-like glycosyltransferase